MPGAFGTAALVALVALPMAAAQPAASVALFLDEAGWTVVGQDTLVVATPLLAFDAYGAAVADLDGDGGDELILLNDNSRAYVVSLRDRTLLAEIATSHPGGGVDWHTQTLNGPAIGDPDGDGEPDLLVLNSGGVLTFLEWDAGHLAVRANVFAHAPDHVETFWQDHPWLEPQRPEERPHLAHGHPAWASGLAMVQSDGLPGQFAFHPNGTLAWVHTETDGHAGPWTGPLRRNGPTLAVFATDDGRVQVREPATGALVWEYRVPPAAAKPASLSVPPAVADVDGDGAMELLIAARQAVDPKAGSHAWMEESHAALIMLRADGSMAWTVRHPAGNPMVHSRAVARDMDGDGVLDWLVLDWNTIGRFPGNWERLGPGNLFALGGTDGRLLWTAEVEAPATDFDVPVAILDGQEVALVPHEKAGRGGVAAFRLTDGREAQWTPIPEGWTATRGVILADAEGDGRAEALVPVHRDATQCAPKDDVGCREGAIAILATPIAGVLDGGHARHADHAVATRVEAARPAVLQAAAPPLDEPPVAETPIGLVALLAIAAAGQARRRLGP